MEKVEPVKKIRELLEGIDLSKLKDFKEIPKIVSEEESCIHFYPDKTCHPKDIFTFLRVCDLISEKLLLGIKDFEDWLKKAIDYFYHINHIWLVSYIEVALTQVILNRKRGNYDLRQLVVRLLHQDYLLSSECLDSILSDTSEEEREDRESIAEDIKGSIQKSQTIQEIIDIGNYWDIGYRESIIKYIPEIGTIITQQIEKFWKNYLIPISDITTVRIGYNGIGRIGDILKLIHDIDNFQCTKLEQEKLEQELEKETILILNKLFLWDEENSSIDDIEYIQEELKYLKTRDNVDRLIEQEELRISRMNILTSEDIEKLDCAINNFEKITQKKFIEDSQISKDVNEKIDQFTLKDTPSLKTVYMITLFCQKRGIKIDLETNDKEFLNIGNLIKNACKLETNKQEIYCLKEYLDDKTLPIDPKMKKAFQEALKEKHKELLERDLMEGKNLDLKNYQIIKEFGYQNVFLKLFKETLQEKNSIELSKIWFEQITPYKEEKLDNIIKERLFEIINESKTPSEKMNILIYFLNGEKEDDYSYDLFRIKDKFDLLKEICQRIESIIDSAIDEQNESKIDYWFTKILKKESLHFFITTKFFEKTRRFVESKK